MNASYVATYSDAKRRIHNRKIATAPTPEAALEKAQRLNPHLPADGFKVKRDFGFTPWRHGGYYTNVRHPSGACGCVSNNYADKRWRIACDPRGHDAAPTFRSRDEAAQAEADLIIARPDLYPA